MHKLSLLALVVAPLLAAPAAAVTFFSIGGAPDPGLASFETGIVDFDGPTAAGIIQTNTGPVGLYTGTSRVAAAPAGNTSRYLGIGNGGAVLFDMRSFFSSQSQRARSLSVYVGSVDAYNFVDVLDWNLATLKTIGGVDLPGSNGNQSAAITNRRLYINFLPQENVGGLRFRSNGVAFELDTIGASRALFAPSGPSPLSFPTASVPEPATWAMLLTGFGLAGTALRRRRTRPVTASL